jgi:hypothetical protein
VGHTLHQCLAHVESRNECQFCALTTRLALAVLPAYNRCSNQGDNQRKGKPRAGALAAVMLPLECGPQEAVHSNVQCSRHPDVAGQQRGQVKGAEPARAGTKHGTGKGPGNGWQGRWYWWRGFWGGRWGGGCTCKQRFEEEGAYHSTAAAAVQNRHSDIPAAAQPTQSPSKPRRDTTAKPRSEPRATTRAPTTVLPGTRSRKHRVSKSLCLGPTGGRGGGARTPRAHARGHAPVVRCGCARGKQ